MAAHAPASQSPLFALCYDISCNRERRRLDKLLCGFGFRVQKSVFECHLGKSQKQQLLTALDRLNIITGHVRIYRVYAESAARTVGKAVSHPNSQFSYSV